MSQGWISIHRQVKEWEWYGDSKIVHLFLHCLMSANHKPKKWKGIQIEAGQFITSRDKLSAELPLSVQQVRTALDKLKSTGEITIKTTTKYSMISITNWSKYQESNQPISQQVTSKQPSNNQQVTTNNNDNNEDNVNKEPTTTSKPKASTCPFDYIVSLYHEILPSNPRIAKLSVSRKAQIKARWNNGMGDEDSWKRYFELVKDSKFLTGQAPPSRDRTKPFSADIDFLIKEANVLKIIEGKYVD
jgi:hypothetical protein